MSTNIVENERASSLSIITNDGYMSRVMTLAKMMASSRVTVPKHLQNNEGDCAAIIMQSMNWGMDAFIVAQKTHVINGILGYEAQLVNAVVKSTNAIKGSFHYEYKDEGGSGETAFVSCRVGAVLNGENEITWGEWLASSSVKIKNSPLWKTNVKQQMGYLQVKNWARAYCPSAILGVYSVDELQDMPVEKDVTPESSHTTKPNTQEIVYYTDDDFVANEKAWKKVISNGKAPEQFIAFIESKGKKFTESQKEEILLWDKKPEVIEGEIVDDPFVSDMNKAESEKK